MEGLPDSKIYEQELKYMPYRESLKKVIEYLYEKIPLNGTLVDLMCGPGYLLGQIDSKRKDLKIKGVDIDKRYISHAKTKYPQIDFELGDILSWQSEEQYEAVICTGSLHHLPYEQQEDAIKKMVALVKPGGFILISDCYIDDYKNEKERKIAAAKLGYEYLKATIQNGGPQEIIGPTIEILWNDVLMKEFKTSLKKRQVIFERIFSSFETFKTWPRFESEYGDYITVSNL